MQTSREGLEFLKRHEGVVLRAYRCPAGVWTIGAGLTRRSGVVDPGPGMEITAEEADRLLAAALRRTYEPRVARALPGAAQHAFDAGVSFDFNTGAIHRASWVAAWARGDWPAVRAGLEAWVRGGGRVLPGLERRRAEEYRLLRTGDYGTGARWPARPGLARVAVELDAAALEAARAGFARLGLRPGADPAGIAEDAVRAFQAAHGLTVDGILGRATLATLQRVLDSRSRAAAPAAGAADLPGLDLAGPVLLAAGLVWAAWLAWTYRDAIAGWLHPKSPRLAAWLRSL